MERLKNKEGVIIEEVHINTHKAIKKSKIKESRLRIKERRELKIEELNDKIAVMRKTNEKLMLRNGQLEQIIKEPERFDRINIALDSLDNMYAQLNVVGEELTRVVGDVHNEIHFIKGENAKLKQIITDGIKNERV